MTMEMDTGLSERMQEAIRKRSKPCKTPGCGHISRDHDRSTKIDGVWTGRCKATNCTCKRYNR